MLERALPAESFVVRLRPHSLIVSGCIGLRAKEECGGPIIVSPASRVGLRASARRIADLGGIVANDLRISAPKPVRDECGPLPRNCFRGRRKLCQPYFCDYALAQTINSRFNELKFHLVLRTFVELANMPRGDSYG